MSRIFPVVVLVVAVSSAQAQFERTRSRTGSRLIAQNPSPEWALNLFDKTSVDFGVIATGASAKKIIRVRNTYKEPVHIRSVATTCVCSGATASKNRLQPGEEATIEVTINTRKFKRRTNANVIVTFDAPKATKLVIPVTAYIRADVAFEPGMVQLGSVPKGQAASQEIRVTHTGRSDWRIVKLVVPDKAIKASFKETHRSGARVDYALKVQLEPGVSVGLLRTLVTLVTDDQSNPRVPVLVEATIEPEFVVTPRTVALNKVPPGSKQEQRIVIRNTNRKPFEIDRIEPLDGEFKYDRPAGTKAVQILPVTIVAPEAPGPFVRKYQVYLKGLEQPLRFEVRGEVQGKTDSGQ